MKNVIVIVNHLNPQTLHCSANIVMQNKNNHYHWSWAHAIRADWILRLKFLCSTMIFSYYHRLSWI